MTNTHFEGCILGLAVGDALGYPCEFRSRSAILDSFGPDGVTGLVAVHDSRWPQRPMILGRSYPAGTYSDDTQMTIAVAEALLSHGDSDLDALMTEMGRRFVDWSRRDDNDRAPGNACMTGCGNLARGEPWRTAGVADSKGCGSAMRVAPIGLFYRDDRERLLEVSRASSLLTHGHDAGVEGAAAGALLVAMALDGSSPQQMYDALIAECAPRSADFAACLEKLPGLLETEPAVALSDAGLGESWVAEQAIAAALYCVWRSPDDFSQVVLTAANTDGDSDSIACIAGSIVGARLGSSAIPEAWRRSLENTDELSKLAAELAARQSAHT